MQYNDFLSFIIKYDFIITTFTALSTGTATYCNLFPEKNNSKLIQKSNLVPGFCKLNVQPLAMSLLPADWKSQSQDCSCMPMNLFFQLLKIAN